MNSFMSQQKRNNISLEKDELTKAYKNKTEMMIHTVKGGLGVHMRILHILCIIIHYLEMFVVWSN